MPGGQNRPLRAQRRFRASPRSSARLRGLRAIAQGCETSADRPGVTRFGSATRCGTCSEAGVLLGSGKLAVEPDRLDRIDRVQIRHVRRRYRPPQDRRPRPDSLPGLAAQHPTARAGTRQRRSAAAWLPCSTGARTDSEQPHPARLASRRATERVVLNPLGDARRLDRAPEHTDHLRRVPPRQDCARPHVRLAPRLRRARREGRITRSVLFDY